MFLPPILTSRVPATVHRGNQDARSVDSRPRCGQLHRTTKQLRGPPWVGPSIKRFDVGGVLLSHTLSSAVPSALEGLASGFGMGPGVPPPPTPPTTLSKYNKPLTEHSCVLRVTQWMRATKCCGQALGLLVPVDSTPHRASIPGLSTPSSLGGLNHARWWETSSWNELPA